MKNYRSVTSLSDLQEFLTGQPIVAFHLKAVPKEPYKNDAEAVLDPHKSRITGIGFSVAAGSAIWVPFVRNTDKNTEYRDALLAWLKEHFFENNAVVKVAHNLVFESMFLCALGIVIKPPCYDTIAAAQLTLKAPGEFRSFSDSSLKTLALSQFYSDISFSAFEKELPDKLSGGMTMQELRNLYGVCVRVDYTLRLYSKFNNWFDRFLPQHRVIVEKLESPTAVYCGLMKYNGIAVDQELMHRRREEADEKILSVKKEIDSITGGVDIGANASTTALKQYLYNDLGLPVVKKTENGQAALDNAAMQMLKDWCAENRPELVRLFVLLQTYRKWNKLKSTYIDGYLAHVNPVTGRIHPDLLPLGTETGRFAAQNPNLQNCPRKANDPIGIRNFFVAAPGNVLLSLDFSQIELRVGAVFCRDQKMLDTYRNGGDIHAQTASVIFDIPFEEAADKNAPDYKEHRAIAKNCNFGVFYGLFPQGLQKTLRFKAGLDTSLDRCREIIRNIKNGYPGLTEWQEQTKKTAQETCYAETWLGRRRYLADMRSEDWSRHAYAERCALNMPIQGTAADILKAACGRILEGLSERPWLHPLLQIHDELVFELPADKLTEAVRFVKACMEQQPYPEFDVPVVAEASAGPRFGEMEELEV